MKYHIAVIKGDGIGPEVIDEAVKVLQAVGTRYGHSFQYTYLKAGGDAIDACGQCLPEETVQKAKESDVPIHRDDKLADTLSRLEIGEMIPPELYEVVAEVLIFVDAMDKLKSKMG